MHGSWPINAGGLTEEDWVVVGGGHLELSSPTIETAEAAAAMVALDNEFGDPSLLEALS